MNKIFNILSVEDNLADFYLLEKALRKIEGIQIEIFHVVNGQHAIDYINKNGNFKEAKDIDLIILDLNLPVLNGLEVLKKLKSDECNKLIPTIIYTTSEENVDVITCYSYHANSYVTKSFEIKDVFEKVKNLGEYWLKTSKLTDNKDWI